MTYPKRSIFLTPNFKTLWVYIVDKSDQPSDCLFTTIKAEMSTLIRNDGTRFVIQAHRELVPYKTKPLALFKIKQLAYKYGRFVKLSNRNSNDLEAVFSTEPGFLLGESIQLYFQQEKNLIFCEKIKESQQNLLVVIKGGQVHSDALIEDRHIHTELLRLTTLQIPFHIVVSKDAPITQNPEQQTTCCFLFPREYTASFERIHAPLFPRLPPISSARLIPLKQALKQEGLRHTALASVCFVVIGILVGMALFFFVTNEKKMLTPHLRSINNTRSASHPLKTISLLIEKLYQLPSQEISGSYTPGVFKAEIKSNAGNFLFLQEWAKKNNFVFHLKPNGVVLSHPIRESNYLNAPLRKETHTTSALLDFIAHALPDVSVQLLTASKINVLQLTLHLLAPQQLSILQQIFRDSAMALHSFIFTINADGLISGVIKLSLKENVT